MTTAEEVEPRVAMFDRWFEPTVFGVIAVNAAVTVWSLLDEQHEEIFEPMHQGLMVFFAAEILIRYAQVRFNVRRFFRNPWNVFDLTLVLVGLLPALGVGVVGLRLLRIARLARIAHSVRHASTLRLAHLTHLFKGVHE
jgi:voltage-gated sodium channel